MSQIYPRRILLLKLYLLLLSETDENHSLSAKELQYKLEKKHLSVDIQTIKSGIQALIKNGFDITEFTEGHHKFYSCHDHIFDIIELKILCDAVSAANCITEKKTNELITKLKQLAGASKAELDRTDNIFSLVKSENENIFRYLDIISTAIQSDLKVSFFYKKNRKYRTVDGIKKRYFVNPITIVYNNGYYYLVAETSDHPDAPTSYRIDRMDDLQREPHPRNLSSVGSAFDSSIFRTQVFSMYTGTPETVTLKLSSNLISTVNDRFGNVVSNKPEKDGFYRATVKVHTSPTFWAWCCTFGSSLKIIAPESAVLGMKQHIAEISKLYEV